MRKSRDTDHEREHRQDAPAPAVRSYFAQPQPPHSQAAHVQDSPLQSGHWHTSQPQPVALAGAFAAVRTQQVAVATGGDLAAVSCWQPQAAHPHTSQSQTPPLQSGHWQSVQPQADFAFAVDATWPALAMAYIAPTANAKNSAKTEYRFMVQKLRLTLIEFLRRMSHRSRADLFQPSAVERQQRRP